MADGTCVLVSYDGTLAFYASEDGGAPLVPLAMVATGLESMVEAAYWFESQSSRASRGGPLPAPRVLPRLLNPSQFLGARELRRRKVLQNCSRGFLSVGLTLATPLAALWR